MTARRRLSEAALDGAVRAARFGRKNSVGEVSVKPRSMARCEAGCGGGGEGESLRLSEAALDGAVRACRGVGKFPPH